MWRPKGTPIMGVPEPIANGHSPHTCFVVPRHSSACCTYVACPRPRPNQPRVVGRSGRGSADFFRFALLPLFEASSRVIPSPLAPLELLDAWAKSAQVAAPQQRLNPATH